MLNHQLSADTQAILLVSASFGQERYRAAKPLRLKEYNDLAGWLRENKMRPEDLLTAGGRKKLEETNGDRFDNQRIMTLLERGFTLSLAVEKWTSQGIWIIGRGDKEYPKSLKKNLQYAAPAILYGVGEVDLLSQGGLAVVGSRDVDEEGLHFTQRVAIACAKEGIQIISGGARGVDINAMMGAIEAGGTAVGVLPDSLTKAAVSGKYRQAIREGRLTLISPWAPDARFTVANAMGRNKHIYALGDRALVVSSAFGKGGTWKGAVEALEKIKNVPLFVRMRENVPVGNRELWKRGAIAFPDEPWNNCLWELLNEEICTRQKETAFELLPEEIEEIVAPVEEEILEPEEKAIDVGEEIVKEVEEKTSPEVSTSQPAIEYRPTNVYEAVLPLILRELERPLEDKALAERLEVEVVGQIQDWLKRAVTDGKVVKNKSKPLTCVANQPAIAPQAGNVYEAVLPFILRNLEQPLDHKTLAERLEIRPKQTQNWLKRAVEEGKVIKNKNPVTYVTNEQESLQLTINK